MCLTIAVISSFMFSTLTVNAAPPLALLLEAPDAVKLIGEYLGLIESLNSKVERLLDADHKTAVSLLEQAKTNPEKAGNLVQDARIYFTRAAAIQSDSTEESRRHKRALALLGLWACCRHTGDESNAAMTMQEIAGISVTPSIGLLARYRLQTRLSGSVVPSFADLRNFNEEYDSLLSMIEAAYQKYQTTLNDQDRPSIVGKWSDEWGNSREFFADGTLKDVATFGTLGGKYQLLEDQRVKIETDGLFYGTNTLIYSYRILPRVLDLRLDNNEIAISIRFRRSD
jgi:hypothetical protein